MRFKILYPTLCFIILFCQQSYAQYHVIKVQDSITTYPKGKGFFYTLPKNFITVNVKITKTQKYKGPFSEYAEKLLGLSGAIQENTNHYMITEIKLSLGHKPDLHQIYFVEYPAKPTDTLWHQFFRNGLVINHTDIQKELSEQSMQINFFYPNQEQQAQFEMYDNYTMYEKIDTNYVTVFIDSSYVQVPKIQKRMVEKTTEQKAEEALNQIKTIREAQWLLLTGEHEVNFENLEFMISSLKKQEKTYLSLFTGFSITEESEYVIHFELPEKQNELSIPLFSFSSQKGINQNINTTDNIYTLRLINTERTSPIKNFLQQAGMHQKKQNDQSFYYRIPEYYQTYIYMNDTEIKNIGIIPINQYGIIDVFPDNIGSFEMDNKTGSLRHIDIKK